VSKTIHLHLVSHASGELIEMLARNSVAQLDGVMVERRLWKHVHHIGQVPEILAAVAETRGFVLHSLAAVDIRDPLEEGCQRLRVPCMYSLEPLVGSLSKHFGVSVRYHTTARDIIDEDYYRRVEAMKYTLAHDDGAGTEDLEGADVVLVGVSRATKTPTCMYLASRGVKAANVPMVPGVPLPDSLFKAKSPLIVGLTVDATRLANVRTDRLKALNQSSSAYGDIEAVREELREARRAFVRRGWPVIDVTRRSIEQVAAMVLKLLEERRKASGGAEV
jgi:regulator of PEP synthase PpsR (kinase-PPPase family)